MDDYIVKKNNDSDNIVDLIADESCRTVGLQEQNVANLQMDIKKSDDEKKKLLLEENSQVTQRLSEVTMENKQQKQENTGLENEIGKRDMKINSLKAKKEGLKLQNYRFNQQISDLRNELTVWQNVDEHKAQEISQLRETIRLNNTGMNNCYLTI